MHKLIETVIIVAIIKYEIQNRSITVDVNFKRFELFDCRRVKDCGIIKRVLQGILDIFIAFELRKAKNPFEPESLVLIADS
jgi:hypothetical protein